jgi:hypothetical protein
MAPLIPLLAGGLVFHRKALIARKIQSLLRFFENYFMASAAQPSRQFLFPSWPPSLLATKDNNRTGAQDRSQCFASVSAKIDPNARFHGALIRKDAETPLIEFY